MLVSFSRGGIAQSVDGYHKRATMTPVDRGIYTQNPIWGTPRTPTDLTRLPSMNLGIPQNEHVWKLFGPDGAQATIHHRPRFITRGMLALRSAAVAGVGIVQLPKMMVGDQIARGELVHLVPDWAPRREIIHAVFPSRRGLLPSVRTLVDFLAERFRELDED